MWDIMNGGIEMINGKLGVQKLVNKKRKGSLT